MGRNMSGSKEERLTDARLEAKAEEKRSVLTDLRTASVEERLAGALRLRSTTLEERPAGAGLEAKAEEKKEHCVRGASH